MKRSSTFVLLIALLFGYALPLLAQASTEGKEFWVALNITTGTGGNDHKPFIYITTQHQGGRYTITNPADASMAPITGLIPATGYVKITIPDDNTGTANLDLNRWYPVGLTAPAASNQIKNVGLKIETTVDCSVFAANSLPQSFDAANILPITALQTDYITQDYPGYDHGGTGTGDGGFPEITILAAENNTQVKIEPSSAILNSNGTATITKTLNAGQVLYLTGENRATLSGSVITSNKKIAVFTGVNNTDVPGPKSARDHLYEQNMPIDYWGTHFVVTRSMKKDANRIRVTASNNGTNISIDGKKITTINAGETYEFELCSPEMRTQSPYTSADAEGRGTKFYFDGAAHYIETSCPCAVFSYDVSENYYISNGTSERDPNAHGDPAMVWISPLEQQLRKVTFGVMNTDNTTAHYVNIITPTEGASSLEVKEVAMNAGQVVYGNNMVQAGDVQPVPGNKEYSYARIKLTENAESVYTITSGVGFIAHVYGSGDKESYAYSCGSAAVQQGVKVNGYTFTNGYRSDEKFCTSDILEFNAAVGKDPITRVDWNFGDGTSESNAAPQVTHQYPTPGWYDVTANLYGHQICTDEDEMPMGAVTFSFRVVEADTIPVGSDHDCIEADSTYNGTKLTAEEIQKMLTYGANDTAWAKRVNCYDPVEITFMTYGIKTTYSYSVEEKDSALVNGTWYYPETVPTDGKVTWTLEDGNRYGCDSIITCNLKVLSCLDVELVNTSAETQYICQGRQLEVPYTVKKGEIISATFTIDNQAPEELSLNHTTRGDGTAVLPTETLVPGVHHAVISMEDTVCEKVLDKHYDFVVRYPDDIFAFKYNNVLAVYQKGYGGNTGFDFTGYQWYRNGQKIEGATSAVYYTEAPFTPGDTYSVELTNAQNVTVPSCGEFVVPDENELDDYTPKKAPSATKKLINRHMYIVVEDKMYDAYGQRVQ